MANTVTSLIPKILARGLLVLRRRCVMPRLVNGDYGREGAMYGSTIDVPIPDQDLVASAVVPGPTPPTPSSHAPTTVQIQLNQWVHQDFFLTQQEMMEIDRNENFVPMQLSSAVEVLAKAVNDYILGFYTGVYGYVGTAGTTPFGSSTNVTDILNVRKVLNNQRCPRDYRRAVLNFDAEANALALSQFSDLQTTGDPDVKIEGELGRKFGFDMYADDEVPSHTAGTITTGLIAKASTVQAVGTTAIVCTTAASTGACALTVGDIILFSGDTQTYTVTAAATQASAATDVTVNISPGKKVALAGSETVTVKGTHVVNLAFHRDAFAFVNRPLVTSDIENRRRDLMSMQDPISGLTMRLELLTEYKQTAWDLDILYGAQLIRPELACRLAG